MKVDVFSMVAAVLLLVLAILAILCFIVRYAHPEDQGVGEAWIPRIVLLLCYLAAFAQVLLIPLDVTWQGIPFWQVFYWIYLAIQILIIPFTLLLYQSDQDSNWLTRIGLSLGQTFILGALFTAIMLPFYFTLSTSHIPIQVISTTLTQNSLIEVVPDQRIYQTSFQFMPEILPFIIGVTTMAGYLVLALCGGMGLTALPLELLRFSRPVIVLLLPENYATGKK